MYDQPFYNGVGRLNVDVEEENHILFTYPSIFFFFLSTVSHRRAPDLITFQLALLA